jgi:hypothetical protein
MPFYNAFRFREHASGASRASGYSRAAKPKEMKFRKLTKTENNAKQFRSNVRNVRAARVFKEAYDKMSHAEKRVALKENETAYEKLKEARNKFLVAHPKMNAEMTELNRKLNRHDDGHCMKRYNVLGNLTPTHAELMEGIDNTAFKKKKFEKVSKEHTDDEDDVYKRVLETTAKATGGNSTGGKAAGGNAAGGKSTGGKAAGGNAAGGKSTGGKAAGGKAAAVSDSDEDANEDEDVAIYVPPKEPRQKRIATLPDGGYIGVKPKKQKK